MNAIATLGVAPRSDCALVRRTHADEPEDHRERPFGAWPELADRRLAARADEVAEDESHENRIVELPRDGDEVRHEIERQSEIGDECDQQQLPTPRDPRIA